MLVTLHKDVIAIVEETAEEYGITPEQAANFLLRFATFEKPGPALSEMLILDETGRRCYRYPALGPESKKNMFAMTSGPSWKCLFDSETEA